MHYICKAYQKIVEFLFPRVCVATKQEGEYLSKDGRKELLAHPEICPASHRFSRDFKTLPGYQKELSLVGIHICFYYGSYLKKLILKLKYYHQKDVIETLIDRIMLSIQTNESLWKAIHSGSCCLSYVPSHWWRKYISKGYNQSELLAQSLSDRLTIPCIQIAKKTKHTRSQTSLSRQARLVNMQGSFAAVNRAQRKQYHHIIVVDDIVTTGATINEIALVAKHCNSLAQIRGLVVGRHNK